MAKDYIDRVNKPENYVRDFDKLLSDFSSGIYFPTLALGVKPTLVNNNFQNLEFQFNLFKDIPLQLKYSQVSNEDEQLLSTGSIPVFFYRSMENLESTASSHEKLACSIMAEPFGSRILGIEEDDFEQDCCIRNHRPKFLK